MVITSHRYRAAPTLITAAATQKQPIHPLKDWMPRLNIDRGMRTAATALHRLHDTVTSGVPDTAPR